MKKLLITLKKYIGLSTQKIKGRGPVRQRPQCLAKSSLAGECCGRSPSLQRMGEE
jgi:hypothetical protein